MCKNPSGKDGMTKLCQEEGIRDSLLCVMCMTNANNQDSKEAPRGANFFGVFLNGGKAFEKPAKRTQGLNMIWTWIVLVR